MEWKLLSCGEELLLWKAVLAQHGEAGGACGQHHEQEALEELLMRDGHDIFHGSTLCCSLLNAD